MKIEVSINGRIVAVVCPHCLADPPQPDPRLIDTDRFWCPACKREFVALSAHDYGAAVAASRPGLLVGDLLRGTPGQITTEPPDADSNTTVDDRDPSRSIPARSRT